MYEKIYPILGPYFHLFVKKNHPKFFSFIGTAAEGSQHERTKKHCPSINLDTYLSHVGDLSFRVDLPISFLLQVRVGNICLSLGASNSPVEWDVKCTIQPQVYDRSENFHPNLKFMNIFYFSLEERSCIYWPVRLWHRYPDFRAYHGLPHLEDRNT